MPSSKIGKIRRRSEAKRKFADDHQSPDRRMKRKFNDKPGRGEKEHQGTGNQPEEALFKIRYAAEFDDGSVVDMGGQADVKQKEQQQDTVQAGEMSQTTASTSLPRPATRPDNTITGRVDYEDIMVTILSQASWDTKMTQATIKSLAGRAQQKASPGNLFDVTYIDGLLTRLDMSGIEAERRTQIVAMLQHTLHEFLGQWKSCIRRVGGSECSTTPKTDTRVNRAGSQDSTGPIPGVVPNSSRLLYVEARRYDEEGIPSHRMQPPDTTSRPSNDEADSNDSGIEDDQDTSARDQTIPHRVIERRDSSPLISAPGPSRMTHTTKSKDNLRVYGTRRPKAPFDIFAKCVISAWALAPKPEDDSVKIRTYARSKWPKVGRHSKERVEWQKLYEARHEPDINVSTLGHKLFLSQFLLQHVVPEDRLQAVRTRLLASQEAFCELRTQKSVPPTTFAQQGSSHPKQLSRLHTPRKLDLVSRINPGINTVSRRNSYLQEPVPVASPAISHHFPRLVQATSTTPLTQACLVPSSTRGYDPNGCLFMLNTPDTVAGRIITEPDVRLACIEAGCKGLKDVTRHNNNIFVVSFETRTKARQADHHLRLHFAIASADPSSPTGSSLTIPASQYVQGPHHVFCCNLRISFIKQATIYERVFEALHGPRSTSFRLLKQDGTDGYVRYLLRRPPSASPIHVERFYIPVDRAGGFGMAWAIFQPFDTSRKCRACHEQCQAGSSSTCPYATLVKKS